MCKLLGGCALAALLLTVTVSAQTQEVGLTLGEHIGLDRTSKTGVRFSLGTGVAYQANYEYRILSRGMVSLYVGAGFLASPQRLVTSTDRTLTRDVATIYVTPNVMLKLFPHRRLQPWATIGGGASVYEQSNLRGDGQPNGAGRDNTHGTFLFGGGFDIPIRKSIALRGEVRDFYGASPAYNTPVSGGQHNVVVGGGFVIRFGN